MGLGREKFLRPEVRNDTVISAEKKAAWKSMLDMLEVFIAVCKKHHLVYYAMGGTMLGAARHQGMIPWDDDIDVMMPREDYDRIQQILPSELPPHMFLQSTLTDPYYLNPHIKIRDSRTSGIDMRCVKKGLRYNYGIFLDIFSIDGVPNDARQLAAQSRGFRAFHRMEMDTYNHDFKLKRERLSHWICWLRFHLMGRKRFYHKRERFFARYRLSECDEWVAAAATFTYKSRYRWPARLFDGGTVELPFEYLQVAVPAQYERMLELTYGDWRKFVKGDSLHGQLLLDAEVPYPQKLKMLGF